MRRLPIIITPHVSWFSYIDSFIKHIEITDDGCWKWTGAVDKNSYGKFRLGYRGGRTVNAARFACGVVWGIKTSQETDHLCRVHDCVNPWHLEAVTHAENVRRGTACPPIRQSEPFCHNGHPMTSENVYVNPPGGRQGRQCRICRLASQAAWYQRTKAIA